MRCKLRSFWAVGFSRRGNLVLTMSRFCRDMVETRFDCPPEIKNRFIAMCAERDETPGAMMRSLMKQELKSWSERRARKDEVRNEPLLARLRLRVAKSYSSATSWTDFITRLSEDDLELRPMGGGLALFDLISGERLAKASDVGPGYSDMIRRFRSGFPGHHQRQLVERVLTENQTVVLVEP